MFSTRAITFTIARLMCFFVSPAIRMHHSVAVFQSSGGVGGRSPVGSPSATVVDLVNPTGGGGPPAVQSPVVGDSIGSPLTSSAVASQCPRTCFCNTLSRIVYCSRRGLQSIPNGIPSNTVQLNLNSNEFQTPNVDRRNFSSLINLEHLYMSECGIERIAIDTFSDLKSLLWLDLSNNRIKVRGPRASAHTSEVNGHF
jgi:hypothetical protein